MDSKPTYVQNTTGNLEAFRNAASSSSYGNERLDELFTAALIGVLSTRFPAEEWAYYLESAATCVKNLPNKGEEVTLSDAITAAKWEAAARRTR